MPGSLPQSSGEPVERRFVDDLHTVILAVRRGWRFVVVAGLIGMTVGVVYLARRKVVYQGTSRLLILQQGRAPLGVAGQDGGRLAEAGQDDLPTHAMILKSPMIVGRALAMLGPNPPSVRAVTDKLSVTRPDPTAKVLQIVYLSEDAKTAAKLVEAITQTYQKFLEEKYQKNNKDVTEQLRAARDDLSNELVELEKKYFEMKTTAVPPGLDESGVSLQARRLEQWDRAANEVMVKGVQLRAQYELGKKLKAEGASPGAVAAALSMVGGPMQASHSGITADGGERLELELAEVEIQRNAAIKLHERMRAQEEALVKQLSSSDLASEFYRDPTAARLHEDKIAAEERLAASARLSRGSRDPSVVHLQGRVNAMKERLNSLWEQKRPAVIEAVLREQAGPGGMTARDAEVNVITLETRAASLREKLGAAHDQRLANLETETRRLVETFGANSKEAKTALANLEKLRKEGDRQGGTSSLLSAIEKSLEAVDAMQAEMRSRFDADMADSRKAETSRLAVANLKSDLDRKRSLFNTVVDQLKQAQLVSDFRGTSAQPIDPAEALPVRSQAPLILGLALVVGLIVGTGTSVVVDQMDQRLYSGSEISQVLGLTMLAGIPRLPSGRLATIHGNPALISHIAPKSRLAECFRVLRTNLDRVGRELHPQVMLVSSARAGDGKSTTSSNLAICQAHNGKRVLLIDADLRRSSLPATFNVSNMCGLGDALRGSIPFDAAIRPTPVKNLDMVPAGPETENPADLLASNRMSEFIETVRQNYDLIIIDSPPILVVADALILSGVSDAMLFVAHGSALRKSDAERCKEVLRLAGLPVLGVVVNGIEQENWLWGHYNAYDYDRYLYGPTRISGKKNPPATPLLPAPPFPKTARNQDVSESVNPDSERYSQVQKALATTARQYAEVFNSGPEHNSEES